MLFFFAIIGCINEEASQRHQAYEKAAIEFLDARRDWSDAVNKCHGLATAYERRHNELLEHRELLSEHSHWSDKETLDDPVMGRRLGAAHARIAEIQADLASIDDQVPVVLQDIDEGVVVLGETIARHDRLCEPIKPAFNGCAPSYEVLGRYGIKKIDDFDYIRRALKSRVQMVVKPATFPECG